jgi:hypothetical protein
MRCEIEIRVEKNSLAQRILLDLYYSQPLLFDEIELNNISISNNALERGAGIKSLEDGKEMLPNMKLQRFLTSLIDICDGFKIVGDDTFLINAKSCADSIRETLILMTQLRVGADRKFISSMLQMVIIRNEDAVDFYAGGKWMNGWRYVPDSLFRSFPEAKM